MYIFATLDVGFIITYLVEKVNSQNLDCTINCTQAFWNIMILLFIQDHSAQQTMQLGCPELPVRNISVLETADFGIFKKHEHFCSLL